MNILIDGQSRSGKLLLAKTLLASSGIAFQHYSGDIERLLEALAFSEHSSDAQAVLLDLLRINLLDTFEDLRQSRQLSLNANDSSYYKKTAFFLINQKKVEVGKPVLEIDPSASFILHTHECESFLTPLLRQERFREVFSSQIKACISIVRNPSAQLLSWISRDYTLSWNSASKKLSPFTLYRSRYNLTSVADEGVELFPWFVDQAIGAYIEKRLIVENDIVEFTSKDLLGLCVCFLTDLYLDLADSLRLHTQTFDCYTYPLRYVVFHEDIHDSKCSNVATLLESLGYIIYPPKFKEIVRVELAPSKFGKESIDESLEAALRQLSSDPVKKILQVLSSRYCHALVESAGKFLGHRPQ